MFHISSCPIGLDISDHSLKFVQLKRKSFFKLQGQKSNHNLKINCYNNLNIPDNLIVNGEIKKPEEVIEQLKKLLNTALGDKINSKEVVATLPARQTFTRLLQITTEPDEQIEEKILKEIVHHIPLSLDEIYLDWQIIFQKENQFQILVAAAPQKIVNQYLQILEEASLQTMALEIEAAAISRCLIPISTSEQQQKTGAYLIIDLGARQSKIILYDDDTIQSTVSAPISGYDITKQLATTLDIDFKKAEKAKIVCGLSKDKCKGALVEILDEMINELINYIKKTTSFFQNRYPEKQIQKIILCGGGANFLDIENVLFEHLRIPIEKGNPWQYIQPDTTDTRYAKIKNNSLSYVTAIGASLRGTMTKKE